LSGDEPVPVDLCTSIANGQTWWTLDWWTGDVDSIAVL
jgi:hypothetical protein